MNKIIILNNKKCRFESDDIFLFKKMSNFLSFKMPGVEYTQAFQTGSWNGITFLMNNDGVFSSGLLTKVENFLQENNIIFEKEDCRVPILPSKEIDLSSKLAQLGMLPRDYQTEIVETSCANRKGIIRACTGAGKTLCMALITAKLNKPTVVYVIGLDLLKQFHDLFSSLFDEPIGYIGNGICKIERINIATIWTIGRSLRMNKKELVVDEDEREELFNKSQTDQIVKMLKTTNVHIFDESHVITTNTIKTIYKTINPESIYGFSGTPFKDDNTDLLINSILGEQIININASRLIKEGFLAQPYIKFMSVPKMKVDTSTYSSVYKNYIVENTIRNNLIVENSKFLIEKKYIPLVLFKQIKHGKILLSMMRATGIKCEMLFGDDSLDRRTEVKKMLINKEIDLILASTIFDLGIDLPILNALILCGSGKSSIRALQRVGRVIRSYKGKDYAAVVDFYDQVKFLKNHALTRYKVYRSEEGFKVIKCDGMK